MKLFEQPIQMFIEINKYFLLLLVNNNQQSFKFLSKLLYTIISNKFNYNEAISKCWQNTNCF